MEKDTNKAKLEILIFLRKSAELVASMEIQ